MQCRSCGEETGDRHLMCWRCRRGLPRKLTARDLALSLVCVCARSRPHAVRGIFGGMAEECDRCGRAVL